MIIELHLLQSFPVSNLNRDDIGQPKTATFGGVTRGRISSQSLKRAARGLFNQYGLSVDETGVRTKRLLDNAAKLLAERHGRDGERSQVVAGAGLEALGFGIDAETRLTQYLLFVGRSASELLADFCEREWDKLEKAAAQKAAEAKKAAEKKKNGDSTEPETPAKSKKIKPDKATLAEARRILDAQKVADIALFGRMIADNKDFSVEAASQVAHALSTHAVANEFDYYTAVDDLKPQDESGADMIGTVDFNSACYYRYANLDLGQLSKNLGGDADLAARTAQAWLYALVHAVPTGKQNSMAARTMPDTLIGVTRETGAWNLANAFLKPVTGPDLMALSTQRLIEHLGQLRSFYGGKDLSVTTASVTGTLPGIEETERATTLEEFSNRVLASRKA
ncbi:type I-E CRISPR-associated protein Cas7/Cse4/CasC [Microbispora bryophytorum]|uniref:Type I-E CRISPR-associated protein Cas7/Cse4/CasC n=1 Tax=Microbispora bryophytorum subsp. camponoti TaxID=1677852 RepID=A0ABR8LE07_9ACTN|nr:type I-E CRISPR-associated protein Cas7/Cse4/CasC [Microbispora camponoti]MBD3148287.1 type I-E CRISPR-associated protein Cas7/Cse4/CasC [Microbispora camponoti]